jgi:D-alanyl-D-alanine dipeptidase
VKREGDGRSPAGVFRLGPAFGSAPPGGIWPFRLLDARTECVDDTASAQYGKTVENDAVAIDWKSSEKMASEPLYRLGAFVEHNTGPTEAGAGSCIFLHVWREEGRGTAGCTAFEEARLREVLVALEPDATPLLVQLPTRIYEQHRDAQGWP